LNLKIARVLLFAMLIVIVLATVPVVVNIIDVHGFASGIDVVIAALGVGFLLVMILISLPAMVKSRLRWISYIGAGLAGIMIIALPIDMYWGKSFDYPRSAYANAITQCIETGITWAAFLCLSSSVLNFRLNAFGRLVQFASVTSMACATVTLTIAEWFYPEIPGVETIFWIALVLSIAGLLSVLTISRLVQVAVLDGSVAKATVSFKCPRCQAVQDVAMGESRCTNCQLPFKIELG